MDADWSVELAAEDPVLAMPWAAPDGGLRYLNLRTYPEFISQLEEVQRFPELAKFLQEINDAEAPTESVKCDVWQSTSIEPAEEVFGGSYKTGSYCDVIFRDEPTQASFAAHERFVQRACAQLDRSTEIPASAEFIVRRCVFHAPPNIRDGFGITVYVFGYGDDERQARRQWAIALHAVGNALASSGSIPDHRPTTRSS